MATKRAAFIQLKDRHNWKGPIFVRVDMIAAVSGCPVQEDGSTPSHVVYVCGSGAYVQETVEEIMELIAINS